MNAFTAMRGVRPIEYTLFGYGRSVYVIVPNAWTDRQTDGCYGVSVTVECKLDT